VNAWRKEICAALSASISLRSVLAFILATKRERERERERVDFKNEQAAGEFCRLCYYF
jgi:hypothetical protein